MSIVSLPLFILVFRVRIFTMSFLLTIFTGRIPPSPLVSLFHLIRTASEKEVKSKNLVVCKGNSWKTGIITLTISSSFSTQNIAESRPLTSLTNPTPSVWAILCKTSMSSTCNSILNLNTTFEEVPGLIKKNPSASVNPANQFRKSLETFGKFFLRLRDKSLPSSTKLIQGLLKNFCIKGIWNKTGPLLIKCRLKLIYYNPTLDELSMGLDVNMYLFLYNLFVSI